MELRGLKAVVSFNALLGSACRPARQRIPRSKTAPYFRRF